ncbi:MAG: hypothetical protein U0K57_05920 [Lachnospiraceae bacterium]|nr:hypothetical protein [Lachnospiraceae bacterium]
MSRGRSTSDEVLDSRIEKAEQKIVSARKRYDQATAELKALLDKRDAIRKEKLMDAFVKSNRSFEEVMKFLTTNPPVEG